MSILSDDVTFAALEQQVDAYDGLFSPVSDEGARDAYFIDLEVRQDPPAAFEMGCCCPTPRVQAAAHDHDGSPSRAAEPDGFAVRLSRGHRAALPWSHRMCSRSFRRRHVPAGSSWTNSWRAESVSAVATATTVPLKRRPRRRRSPTVHLDNGANSSDDGAPHEKIHSDDRNDARHAVRRPSA